MSREVHEAAPKDQSNDLAPPSYQDEIVLNAESITHPDGKRVKLNVQHEDSILYHSNKHCEIDLNPSFSTSSCSSFCFNIVQEICTTKVDTQGSEHLRDLKDKESATRRMFEESKLHRDGERIKDFSENMDRKKMKLLSATTFSTNNKHSKNKHNTKNQSTVDGNDCEEKANHQEGDIQEENNEMKNDQEENVMEKSDQVENRLKKTHQEENQRDQNEQRNGAQNETEQGEIGQEENEQNQDKNEESEQCEGSDQDLEDTEEEDEDDEEEDDKIDETLQGFIVNEVPESEADSKEEDDEDDEQPMLDDDDLELIAENTGIRPSYPPKQPPTKFRRLKRRIEEDESEDHTSSSSKEFTNTRLEKSGNAIQKVPRYMSEQREFSTEEVDEDSETSENKEFSDGETFGLHPKLLVLIRHIFCDVGTVMEILGRRRHREELLEDFIENRVPCNRSPYRSESLIPQSHGSRDRTSFNLPREKCDEQRQNKPSDDLEINLCYVNRPERHALLYKNREKYYPLEILQREAFWIASRILSLGLDTLGLDGEKLKRLYLETFGSKSRYYDPEATTVKKDLVEKVSLFLHLLLNEHLETPTIILHFGHRLCPPLTERLAWVIVDLDKEWSRLARDSECVSALVDRLPASCPDLPFLRQKLSGYENEHDIDDVRHYVNFYSKTSLFPETVRQGRKHAASSTSISLCDIQRYDFEKHWSPYLLSPQDFASNLEKSEAFSSLISSNFTKIGHDLSIEQLPLSEPPMPGRSPEALNAWLSSLCSGPFNTGARVLEALLALESRKLAVSVRVRDCLRRWFYTVARITTVLTDTGSSVVTLGKRNWPTLNLRNKPVKEFLSATIPSLNLSLSYSESYQQMNEREYMTREATAFLEILHAESLGHVSILIHPLVPTDHAPWRPTNDTASPFFFEKYNLFPNECKTLDETDSRTLDTLLHILTNLYVISPSSLWATEVQIKILERLVHRELLMLFRKELRSLLQRRAEFCVSILCHDSLKWRLNLQPYRRTNGKKIGDRELDYDEGSSNESEGEESSGTYQESEGSHVNEHFSLSNSTPRVCGLVIKRTKKNVCVHALCVDRKGFPTHYSRFESLLTHDLVRHPKPFPSSVHWENDEDFKKSLRQLFKQSKVELVVIAASDLLAKHLYEIVLRLRPKLKPKNNFDIVFASLEVPRLYAMSHACTTEHKKAYGVEGCQAMGLARLLQDPLVCYLQLWSKDPNHSNLLLHLKYHPLQHLLLPERLETALEQAAITVVASVGVDINALRQKPHTQCLLQFVPGLGPTKAQFLLSNLSGPVSCRSAILKILDQMTTYSEETSNATTIVYQKPPSEPSVNVVYRNCASFLRLSRSYCLNPNASDPLACTRIHPLESYTTAYKTARDALEDVKRSMTPQKCVISVIRHPSCLDELDLEEYSYILEEKGQCRMLSYLEMIRKELENPYADHRFPFQEPLSEELFYLLTEENRFDFLPGCKVIAHIIESHPTGTVTLMVPPSGIVANALDVQNYLSQECHNKPHISGNHSFNRHSVTTVLPLGGVVSCRIESINFSEFLIYVLLSDQSSSSLLATILPVQNPRLVSPQFTSKKLYQILQFSSTKSNSLQLNSQAYDSSGNPRRIVVRRRIYHPRFRMTLPSRAIRELKIGAVGDALITPNEGSLKELILTINICKDPYSVKTVLIEEFDQSNTGELGKTLKIGSAIYTSLDSIFAQYVEGLRVNLTEIYAFEKYYNGPSLDSVENSLIDAQKKKTTATGRSTIEWGITVDTSYPREKPGVRFHLIAIPPPSSNKKSPPKPVIFKDGIYVTPEGFRLWNRKERSLCRLINWWKSQGYFQRSKLIAEYNMTKKNFLNQEKNKNFCSRSFPQTQYVN